MCMIREIIGVCFRVAEVKIALHTNNVVCFLRNPLILVTVLLDILVEFGDIKLIIVNQSFWDFICPWG